MELLKGVHPIVETLYSMNLAKREFQRSYKQKEGVKKLLSYVL